MSSTPQLFGRLSDGTPIHRLSLDNGTISVRILEFGAALQSIEVPDHRQQRANVILGLTTLEDYVARSPHMGAIPGRYAGRIAQGCFTLDGTTYYLPRNAGGNTLHGGPHGFGKRAWTFVDYGANHATLGLTSPDGEAGFPGTVEVRIRYTLDGPALRIDLHAETDRPTVINLTNHAYFNLAGEGSGDILGHELTIDSDTFLPIDGNQIPTGEHRSVAGTPFDFRTCHAIGRDIRQADPQLVHALGYDHAFMLPGEGLRRAAHLHDPGTKRTLTVSTTQPALQVYSGNSLTGTLAGPSGHLYRQSAGIALEAQHPQDSPNQPGFPSTVLLPGTPFKAAIVFEFGISAERQD